MRKKWGHANENKPDILIKKIFAFSQILAILPMAHLNFADMMWTLVKTSFVVKISTQAPQEFLCLSPHYFLKQIQELPDHAGTIHLNVQGHSA